MHGRSESDLLDAKKVHPLTFRSIGFVIHGGFGESARTKSARTIRMNNDFKPDANKSRYSPLLCLLRFSFKDTEGIWLDFPGHFSVRF